MRTAIRIFETIAAREPSLYAAEVYIERCLSFKLKKQAREPWNERKGFVACAYCNVDCFPDLKEKSTKRKGVLTRDW